MNLIYEPKQTNKKKQTEAPIDVLGNKRNKYREDSYL